MVRTFVLDGMLRIHCLADFDTEPRSAAPFRNPDLQKSTAELNHVPRVRGFRYTIHFVAQQPLFVHFMQFVPFVGVRSFCSLSEDYYEKMSTGKCKSHPKNFARLIQYKV